MIPNRLFDILRSCKNTGTSYFPPTEVFNEGWFSNLSAGTTNAKSLSAKPLGGVDRAVIEALYVRLRCEAVGRR